jgi:hypothetical protein
MFVCVFIGLNVCCVYSYALIFVCVYIHKHKCLYVRVFICINVCMCVCVCIHMHKCLLVCIHVHKCINASMCVCLHAHTDPYILNTIVLQAEVTSSFEAIKDIQFVAKVALQKNEADADILVTTSQTFYVRNLQP